MRPPIIFFDWDNTLVDSWDIIHYSLVHTFEKMGHEPWTMQETKQKVAKSMRESFPELFGDRWEEAANYFQSYFQENHLKNIKILDGAKELLDTLQEMNIQAAVISNKRGNNLRAEVSHIGWQKYFFAVIGAEDAKEDKPSPAPLEMALQEIGERISPDMWLYGDSEIDLKCAKNSGIVGVHYVQKEPIGDLYFTHHQQLIDYLHKL